MTSRETLAYFRDSLLVDPNGELDASQLLSDASFSEWQKKNASLGVQPNKASFIKSLRDHIQGSDGAGPFTVNEEKSILKAFREGKYGEMMSDNIRGYHERKSNLKNIGTGRTERSKNRSLSETRLQSVPPTSALPENTVPRKRFSSSYEVFVQFAAKRDAQGSCCVLSKGCFDTWVRTRRHGVKNAEHSFRKALIAHLCGKDGRRPFPESIEPAVVAEIRKKGIWPCFLGNTDPRILNIGNKGFRHFAYHEGKHAQSLSAPSKPLLKTKQLNRTKLRRNSAYCKSTVDRFSSKKRRMAKSHSIDFPEWSKEPERGSTLYSLSRALSEPRMMVQHPTCSSSDHLQVSPVALLNVDTFGISNFFFDCFEEKEAEESVSSVFNDFSDVSSEEMAKVCETKTLTKSLFSDYFSEVESRFNIRLDFNNAKDIAGDVKILRLLRVSRGSTIETVHLVKKFLQWRLENNVDEIRQQLIKEDPTFMKIKKDFILGKNGGCFPFYKQLANGDFVDVWKMKDEVDNAAPLVEKRLEDHIYLAEFRSIVLDELSYKLRRVVHYKTLWDCTCVKRKASPPKNRNVINWLKIARELRHYVFAVIDLTWKWYGGSCSKAAIFGKGYVFQALLHLGFKTMLGSEAVQKISVYGSPSEYTEMLEKTLEIRLEAGDSVFDDEYKGAAEDQIINLKLSELSGNVKGRR